jgi:CRP-like cAMP-binding protein
MLFATLETELKERLIAVSPTRIYSDGQFIQQRGSKADGFWLIEQGNVRIGQYLPEGEFRAMAVLGAGDSYGELAVFSGSRRVVDALSRGQSEVRFIAANTFLTALEDYPKSNQAILGALSMQLQDTLEQLASMRRGSNPARLADMLYNLAGGSEEVATTQDELAELLGVTRATTNAALRTLEKAGYISRGYAKILIINSDALALFALRSH